MLDTYHNQAKKRLIATVVSLIIIAGVVLYADHIKASRADSTSTVATTGTSSTSRPSSSMTDTTPTTSDQSSASGSSSSSSSSAYKDGTYSATSDYYVPHGSEQIEVTLTLKDGTITGSSIKNSESDRESVGYQEDFASAYKNFVVGKKIIGLQLSTISGASDTTQGFNDAVSQIASKAQS